MQRLTRRCPGLWRHWRRSESTSAQDISKSLSKTLFLPKTDFPLWPKREDSEIALRPKICEDLYNKQATRQGELFVLHDGPPYANGSLHMGHAMNKILKDIINRYNVLCGKRVQYYPGWDCHGLPIENKALKDLGADSSSLSPTAIRTAARATALREIDVQKKEFEQFGLMVNWDNATTYRTLDHDYEIRQLNIFKKMVEKGLIYRHYRPVHYSPSSRSALAEAELVYKEDHVSHSVYVTFDLDLSSKPQLAHSFGDKLQLLVWTTTPWTLTANMGIAVHADMAYSVVKRIGHDGPPLVVAQTRLEALSDIIGPVDVIGELQGDSLVGALYKPIFKQTGGLLPIIHASHVTSESGSGLVHCAPAHGAEDYNAFRGIGIQSDSILCHVDSLGQFSGDVCRVVGDAAGRTLVGQPVLEGGSRAIVELLKTEGALVKIKRIKHKYPYDWRTNEPIIVTATSQWFANLDQIKKDALETLEKIEFFPEISRNRLESFVRGRSEWCISRQRSWGVPIPALHHQTSDATILSPASLSHIISTLQEKGVQHWWDGPVEDFLPPHLLHEKDQWRKGTDTMDVWFDSGSSWSLLEPREPFRADVCVEGSDQHRGWFQSQLLTSVGVGEKVPPYGRLVTHGMVLDEKGKKMSKSLGNVLSPLTVVHGGANLKKEPAYGADVLRLWVASVEYWRDVSVGPKVLAQTAESLRKVRNSARFMLGTIGDFSPPSAVSSGAELKELEELYNDMDMADRYLLHQAVLLERSAFEDYHAFNFPRVVINLVNFANISLSSLYLDINKDSLYANALDDRGRRATVAVMKHVLKTMIRVAAPILPHLAQEVYQSMYPSSDGSVFLDLPREPLGEALTQKIEKDSVHMDELLRIRSGVLGLLEKARGNKELKSSLEAEVDIILPSSIDEGIMDLVDTLVAEQSFLQKLFIVSDVSVTDEGSMGTTSPAWVYSGSVDLENSEEAIGLRVRPSSRLKCPRCWTFRREESKHVCERCGDKLRQDEATT